MPIRWLERTRRPALFLLWFVACFRFGEAADNQTVKMTACEPKSCGVGPNVSYPFWINGVHPKYCGMRLFRLGCDGGYPVLPILGDNYTIYNVSNDRQTVDLGKPVPEGNISCDQFPNRNLTVQQTPFTFSTSNNASLLFFFHCNQTLLPPFPIDTGIQLLPLPCDKLEIGFRSFVYYSPPPQLPFPSRNQLLQACNPPVTLPITPLPTGSDITTSYKHFRITLNWIAQDCTICRRSGGICGTNFTAEGTSFNFMCICSDRDYRVSCDGMPRSRARKWKVTGFAMAGGAGILTALLFFFICRQRYFKNDLEDSKDITIFLEKHISPSLIRFKYKKLKSITKSFSEKLGQGGYGEVFMGKLTDDHLVAVKVLNESKANIQEFTNEVASIGRMNHMNIVGLLGFCLEGPKMALVYEFMPNGSLEKFLKGNDLSVRYSLHWEGLYKIANGIAMGLEYLHNGCTTRVVHFDIKPHNILLDEDFNPKISDFGLCKLHPSKESNISMTIPRGTIGYIAPEVFSRSFGIVSSKADVYSYGMLILEMVGVRSNKDFRTQSNKSSIYFPQWIYEKFDESGNLNIDIVTIHEHDHVLVKKMVIIGLWCIQTNPTQRPHISKVVQMLNRNLEELEMPPKPYTYSTNGSKEECESSSLVQQQDTLSS